MTPPEPKAGTPPATKPDPTDRTWSSEPRAKALSRRASDRRAARRADVRFRLLRALETTPDLSQRGLAETIGVSLGTANALLNGLIETGLVNIADAAAEPARFRISYVLTDDGRSEIRAQRVPYLARRRAERAALDAEIAALEAETTTA